jgi:hypothetical protein
MTAEWNTPTPSGHAYKPPTTMAEARERCNDFAQGEIESWDAAERIPDPTWEVVGMLIDEIERLQMIPALVHNDFKSARDTNPDGESPFYTGALDAIDEVGRRMMEADCG